ncbi:MAG: hypothetical protein IPK97_05530 [Ahniella sp.]|nr:hypothetical protein [Ahniella sp.]
MSGDCRGCHDGLSNGVFRQFLPSNTWGGSMMAHAGRDPLFWAALDVANNDIPGVGEWCLRCHAPQAFMEGRVKGVAGGSTGCALQGDYAASDDGPNDFSGVGCHLCHRQVKPASPFPPPAKHDSGNIVLDDNNQCGEFSGPCRYGPYKYEENDPLTPPHASAYSPFVKQGEFCGSCHDVTSPIVNGSAAKTLILSNGTDTGIPFPIERTFSEWKASAFGNVLFNDGFADREPSTDEGRFGRTCQSCHMPKSTSPEAFACMMTSPGSRAGNLPVHEFVGANVWMLTVVKNLYGMALDRVVDLDASIARTLDMLQNRSATMAVSLDPFGGPGQNLTARVRVTNLSGHKLPTGYSEGRRMWLNVEARDANGALIFESGAYNAGTAVLTEDAQAKVYEVQQGMWNSTTNNCDIKDSMNRKEFHFVLNNCIAKDNRIPPQGFTGALDPEIRPVNYVYPETSPGSGVLVNYDDTTYTIPVPNGTPLPVSVRARLQHQVASKEYIEFLSREATTHNFPSENTMCAPRVLSSGPRTQTRAAFMVDQWNTTNKSPPVVMEDVTATTAVR